jgi:plastocyanin
MKTRIVRNLVPLLSALALSVFGASCGSDNQAAGGRGSQPGEIPGPVIHIVHGAMSLGSQAYSPSALDITSGTQVTWVNDDDQTHTATADSGAFDTGSIAPGGRATVTVTQSGSVAYFCRLHPTMHGMLQVAAAGTAPTPTPAPMPSPAVDPFPNLPDCPSGYHCGMSCGNEGYHCNLGNEIRNCYLGKVYCSGS